MAKNVMTLRVIIEGLEEEIVHERDLNAEIPTTILDNAIYVDLDLMIEKLKQEVVAKLREVADDIEAGQESPSNPFRNWE